MLLSRSTIASPSTSSPSCPSWVGLGNYISAFTEDELFPKALGNTAYYVLFSVPLGLMASLLLALLMDRNIPFRAAVAHRLLRALHRAGGGLGLPLRLSFPARVWADQRPAVGTGHPGAGVVQLQPTGSSPR